MLGMEGGVQLAACNGIGCMQGAVQLAVLDTQR
jgi:hypothetical protein